MGPAYFRPVLQPVQCPLEGHGSAAADVGRTTVSTVDPTFRFAAELWLHDGGSWVFAAVPEDESDEIDAITPHFGGFGSVRVEVQIGDTSWRTSVFPDSRRRCFVLPIKKAIRTAEGLEVGDRACIELTVLMD